MIRCIYLVLTFEKTEKREKRKGGGGGGGERFVGRADLEWRQAE